jgi:hypothetical protein
MIANKVLQPTSTDNYPQRGFKSILDLMMILTWIRVEHAALTCEEGGSVTPGVVTEIASLVCRQQWGMG